jgi:hypothetical protein
MERFIIAVSVLAGVGLAASLPAQDKSMIVPVAMRPAPEMRQGEPPAQLPGGQRRAPWRRWWLDRDASSSESLGLRSAFWEELRHVPTLEKYLRQLAEIQKSRLALEQRRRDVAMRSDRPSNEALTEFHEILRQEDGLTSRAADVFVRLKADRATIEKEVRKRMAELDQRSTAGERKEGREAKEGKEGRGEGRERTAAARWRRFYSAVLTQMERLDETTDIGDWMGGVMRNLWQPERESKPTVEGALRQIDHLQHEQEELRRRLENIQNQLDDLAELLMSLQTGAAGAAPAESGPDVVPAELRPTPDMPPDLSGPRGARPESGERGGPRLPPPPEAGTTDQR